MARRTPYSAVIFDLDGVLVDSEIWWDEVRHDFARSRERPWTDEDRAAVMGSNSRQWARTMRERLQLDLPEEAIERAIVDGVVARYRAEGAPHIEGAVDAVRSIAERYPVAVASSAHHDVIEAALDATGLSGLFAAVVSSDEVAHGKPEPDVYLETARRLDVQPDRCLVVEDSLNGVRAAKAAGMAVVLVPNRSIPPADGTAELADVVLEHLAELDPAAVPRRRRSRRSGAAARRENAPETGVDEAGVSPAPRAPGSAREAGSARTPATRSPGQGMRTSRPPTGDDGWSIVGLRRRFRYAVSRVVVGALVRAIVRLRVEGLERLPGEPAIYCFNHMNWSDPFFLLAALPSRPAVYFFGPAEEDMGVGPRNRLMAWSGTPVPYKPGKNDLLDTTRRVRAVFAAGGALAIAGEGRIHAGESELLPFSDGPAYFALRNGVPIVPVAINGTSWLTLGRRVRIRVGEPIPVSGRPTRTAVEDLTKRTWQALHAMVRDQPDYRAPGRFGRWLTELFNDWPEGERPPTPPRDAARSSDAGTVWHTSAVVEHRQEES